MFYSIIYAPKPKQNRSFQSASLPEPKDAPMAQGQGVALYPNRKTWRKKEADTQALNTGKSCWTFLLSLLLKVFLWWRLHLLIC